MRKGTSIGAAEKGKPPQPAHGGRAALIEGAAELHRNVETLALEARLGIEVGEIQDREIAQE